MVIRYSTRCPRCGKQDSVFDKEYYCSSCKLESFFRSQIKANLRQRKFAEQLRSMQKDIKKKLHDKLLKEILDEEKNG